MTIEELQAELEDAKAGMQALSEKNKELIGELRKARAKAGETVDADKYNEALAKVEELTAQISRTEKQHKTELDKATKSAADKDAALQRLLIDGGLSDALAKAGVRPEFMDAAKALLRGQAAIKADGDKIEAVIGDKPISDFISEWASDAGKHFVAAPQNSGTGATGSTTTTTTTIKTKADLLANESAARELYKTDPVTFNKLMKEG